MKPPVITQVHDAVDAASPALDVGLTTAEYAAIREGLGRAPSPTELHCFGVMWSEHCAYKHSREALRRLPSSGPRVLQGPGENAGVVDIGGGWALVWKMESHNHPSAVDPYNGAATGVGGIIRDVLAMGARPIALLDSLRFGPLDHPATRRLMDGVVAGIAGYGNSIGVPTVGGELAVDPSYEGNPLVNVACLGLIRADRVARGRAERPGTVLLYAGARTGRDGIGGAAFASEHLDVESAGEDRSAIQIGDPLAGKSLVESTLAALETGRVLALQDMGAGGLTCAAAEMAARGGCGVRLDLRRVPRREADMSPREVLLSESQERMLLVVAAPDVHTLAEIYTLWGLEAEIVGEVTSTGHFVAVDRTPRDDDAPVVDVPVTLLTNAPARRVAPRPVEPAQGSRAPTVDPGQMLLRLLATPEVADKSPVFEQYDHTVQTRTVVPPGLDAAVLRLPEAPPRGVALTVDGNGRWCAGDPYAGAVAAVVEAAANLACVGAEPLAVTDCLNFASPERPETSWAFDRAVSGIAGACRALDVPVVGGNVSFYNDGPDGPIIPTPAVAMAGLVREVRFPQAPVEGDLVVLLGHAEGALERSLFAREAGAPECGGFPLPDVPSAMRAIACAREAVGRGIVRLAHDVADGGPAVSMAECCLSLGVGAEIVLPAGPGRDESLFGEGGTQFIVILPAAGMVELRALAGAHNAPLAAVGRLGGARLQINLEGEAPGEPAVDVSLIRMRRAWRALVGVFA